MAYMQMTATVHKHADFTPDDAATIYLIDASAAAVRVTLRAAAVDENAVYQFIRTDDGAAGHALTVAARQDSDPVVPIADTIAGGTSITIPAGGARTVASDNRSAWHVLGGINDQTTSAPAQFTVGTGTSDGDVLTVNGGAGNGIFLTVAGENGYGLYSSVQAAGGVGLYAAVEWPSPGGIAAWFAGGPIALTVVIAEQVATPSAGHVHLFLDNADGVLKAKTSDGVLHALW